VKLARDLAVVALLAVAAVMLALAGAGPAKAATPVEWPVFGPPPANKRVIEVVDKVPGAWKIGAAVTWLDRYTASDMRLVSRCSGKAYRCVTVKTGKVKGAPVGWSQGSTITIDTGKASGSMRRYYRFERNRTWLLIHELGHQHGLGHSTGRNVMNQYVNRYKLVLSTGQRSALKSR
jgi:hypothetical protein